jgi:uncharacterized protein YciI
MSDTTPSSPTPAADDRLPEIYALIWRSHQSDDTFDPAEFQSRIPRLMEWLRDLKSKGKLVGCGGGAFENHSGGLTLVRAESIEEAQALAKGTPMNEIGSTEIMIWDVFYADLVQKGTEPQLDARPA